MATIVVEPLEGIFHVTKLDLSQWNCYGWKLLTIIIVEIVKFIQRKPVWQEMRFKGGPDSISIHQPYGRMKLVIKELLRGYRPTAGARFERKTRQRRTSFSAYSTGNTKWCEGYYLIGRTQLVLRKRLNDLYKIAIMDGDQLIRLVKPNPNSKIPALLDPVR